jgi:hypothetical protein
MIYYEKHYINIKRRILMSTWGLDLALNATLQACLEAERTL